MTIVFIALLAWYPFRNLTWDEPHIFYHYAKNLASGNGLVFNRGERVLGFTSPLYQFVLALCAFFTSNLPYLGNLISLFSIAGLAIMVFLALVHINLSLLGFITAVGLVLWPTPYNYIGMETLFLSFLVFSSFYFFIKGRFTLTAVFISLAMLTRFDSILPAAVLLAAYISQEKRCPWKLIGIAIAILIPWIIFSLLYYGVVLPQTFYAKKSMLSLSDFLSKTLWEYGFLFNASIDYHASYKLMLLPWFLLPFLGIAFGIRKSRYFYFILFYMIGIAVGYACFGRMEEPWPVFPFALGMRIFLFYGIHQVATFFYRLTRVGKWPQVVYTGILLILSSPVLIGDLYLIRNKPESRYIQYLFVSRMEAYEDAGKWLEENASPNATVFAPEPGTLAYYSGCIFFDYYGLVTRRGWKVPLQELGRKLRPDYIVVSDGYLKEIGPDLPPEYEVVRVFKSPPYPPVRISRRRNLIR